MDIIISNLSEQPIYNQITQQIKSQIISGKLKEGDMLPSMRVLAKELRISVITTKRAYDDLEREGFITSVVGKGTYVAGKNIEFVREENLKQIEEYMKKIIDLSVNCDIKLCDLIDMFKIMYEVE